MKLSSKKKPRRSLLPETKAGRLKMNSLPSSLSGVSKGSRFPRHPRKRGALFLHCREMTGWSTII